MRIYLLLLLLFAASVAFGQISYTGHIGSYPIELVTGFSGDGPARAVYSYTKHDTPIPLHGTLKKGRLELLEEHAGEVSASLSFPDYSSNAKKLQGRWTDKKTGKTLEIVLHKNFDLDEESEEEYFNREMLQAESLEPYYFKLLVSKTKDDYRGRVSGIKIIEKKTDKVLQKIELDCQLLGLYNVSVDDYNFDGIDDFSVFESSYAGPNTSSVYLLYDPARKIFFDSGFGGTSLEFDSASKTIFERNQCCAGSTVTTALYTVRNNKMVLLEEHCFKYDEESDELVERDLKECR